MHASAPERPGRITPSRRFPTRFILLAIVGIVSIGVCAGLAFAKTRATPLGTGVVVIETNLAYANGAAAGTGMVLTSSGEILTNNHVIRGATTIKVVLPGTGRSYTAKVVGYDVTDDVAVLQATGASNLRTISIGRSSTVKVGQTVTATGNANGTGALDHHDRRRHRPCPGDHVSDDAGGTERLSGLIETSAALEPGDSGGPLLNAAGKVVGMNTAASVPPASARLASTDGYAIPIDTALSIADQIEDGKASATVHVGAPRSSASAWPRTATARALVAGVVSGGSAAAAGLTAGDVITALDGHAVSSSTALQSLLLSEKPGARVSITYIDTSGAARRRPSPSPADRRSRRPRAQSWRLRCTNHTMPAAHTPRRSARWSRARRAVRGGAAGRAAGRRRR